MRVAMFIDGKNFYSGHRASMPSGSVLDFTQLTQWMVKRVGGSVLWGAYYYTGVETGQAAESPSQKALHGFLRHLELQPGFFVTRFTRQAKTHRCDSCGHVAHYTQEKEVDTTMVADMLRLAAVSAFDIMVLCSGDADLTPAVEGVRAIGKQAYVATWGGVGLSARIRQASFDHINLIESQSILWDEQPLEAVAPPPALPVSSSTRMESPVTQSPFSGGGSPPSPSSDVGVDAEDVFMAELRKALAGSGGTNRYVGASYFTHSWKSERLSQLPSVRQRILNKLIKDGRVEVYTAHDGSSALRIVGK